MLLLSNGNHFNFWMNALNQIIIIIVIILFAVSFCQTIYGIEIEIDCERNPIMISTLNVIKLTESSNTMDNQM